MSLNKSYLEKFIKATEFAAYGASPYIGKGDKNAADKGAVDMMRVELNKIDMSGTVVIGEGEMDEAPMLYIGEKVGTTKGPELDIAIDPLEGTNFTAKNLPNAFSVLAVAEKGNILSAPDTYMEKIVIGEYLPKNLLDLDNSVQENIELLAEAKTRKISELSACILDRPRHKQIIDILIKLKVKINFITDGDIAGALSVVGENPKNDIYLGIGGGPEGVITAAALSCYGGQIQGRLVLDAKETLRAKKMGIKDLKKKYNIEDMIKGDVIFCASGITNGDLVKGISVSNGNFEVSTLALHKSQDIKKIVINTYKK
jgi:fructose-1,6-bisphosphatase II / sedoheptulose-1,7-bisphosphatase|tara:strand:- start:1112 stop:2053 length:942 start_codon:yes stop_codon:yes gene_type:complete